MQQIETMIQMCMGLCMLTCYMLSPYNFCCTSSSRILHTHWCYCSIPSRNLFCHNVSYLASLASPHLAPGPCSAFCAYRGRLKGGGTDNIAMTARTCTFSPSAPSRSCLLEGYVPYRNPHEATNKPPDQLKQKQCHHVTQRARECIFCFVKCK